MPNYWLNHRNLDTLTTLNLERVVFVSTLLFIFIIPWRNLVYLGETLGTIGRVFGLFIAGIWGINVLWRGRLRVHTMFAVLAGGLLLWSLLSVLWSTDAWATVGDVTRYSLLVGMAIILIDVYDAEWKVHLGLQSFVIGAFVGIGVLLIAFVSAGAFDGNIRRLTAGAFNPNRLGGLFALTLPVAAYLLYYHQFDRSWLRLINGTFIPVAAFSIVLTGSRQAMVALVPSAVLLIYLAVSTKPWRLYDALGIITIAGFTAMPFIMPERLVDRIYSIPGEIASGELEGRGEELRSSIDLIAENLLLGVGAGNRVYSPHNTFARVGMELGIVGLLLLGGLLLLSGLAVYRRRNDRVPLLVVGAVWIIISFVNHWNLHATTWFFFAMFVALDPVLRENQWTLRKLWMRITLLRVPKRLRQRSAFHE